MDDNPKELFDKTFVDAVKEAASYDLGTEAATTVMKNLKLLSEVTVPDPAPKSTPEPTTLWDKTKAGVAKVWDNETTRVLIKAGGAFAGVATVAYTTIHKDHVMERQALAQANQRPS